MNKEVLSAATLAGMLAVHPATLAEHLPSLYKQGLPKPIRIGRCRRWARQAVLDWLAGRPVVGTKSETEELLEDIRAF